MYNTDPSGKFPCVFALLAVAAMVLGSCAGQRPPQGGPPDTTPPEIVRSVPAPGATNVHPAQIHLEFSEYVDRRSVEQSVFVSPPLGRLEYSWSGTEVDISIPDTLREQTTYILSIGTDVVDLRNKNNMASTFALPFSTGDRIDSGKIAGVVYDPKAPGVFIFAYLLTGARGDTLSPARTKPDFVTQVGTGGRFTLTNLPLGTFRLVAVRDELRNLLYDVQSDDYGMLPGDVTLSRDAAAIAGIGFQMTREDTGRPFLSSASSLFRNVTRLKFSEPVDPASVHRDSIAVMDTVTRAYAELLEAAPDPLSRAQITLVTGALDTAHAYEVSVAGVRDDAGNPLSTARALFTPSGARDTARLSVDLAGIADSSADVAPDDTLLVVFGAPVRRGPFENGFSFAAAAGESLRGELDWQGAAAVRFVPARAMTPGAWYRMRVAGDSVQGVDGTALRESVWVRRFRVLEDRKLSSISGSVVDSVQGAGPVVVTASLVGGRKPRLRTATASGGGRFAFPMLPEGNYALSAYRDADTNGRYSYGLPSPLRPAERFTFFADTLKLRARWPLEGVVLRLK